MTLPLQKEWETRIALRAEGDKLYAEGNKLYAEGNKLRAEGDLVFINAVIAHYGNVKIDRIGDDWIINGDTYKGRE